MHAHTDIYIYILYRWFQSFAVLSGQYLDARVLRAGRGVGAEGQVEESRFRAKWLGEVSINMH